MPESIDDYIKDLDKIAKELSNGGFMADKFRRFVRSYYSEYRESPVVMYALYHAFIRIHGEDVKESYFRSIIRKAWVTYTDENNIEWVHLNKQKKIRTRSRKV